jgi:hypothetical protein
MPDTYTSRNRLTLQEIGGNESTWGDVLNQVISLTDDSLDGQLSLDVTLGDITLTINNGASDQSRYRLLDIVSNTASNREVVLPDVQKMYYVKFTKGDTGNVVVRNTSDVVGITLSANFEGIVRCNGSTTVEFNPADPPTPLVTILTAVYPVGSLYINTSVATNPATLFGFGTWVAHAPGRVLVGLDAGDPSFDTLGETGGAKTHTLTVDEMPSHTHTVSTYANTTASASMGGQTLWNTTTRTTSSAGGDQAHNNLQPYITVYMWTRTA